MIPFSAAGCTILSSFSIKVLDVMKSFKWGQQFVTGLPEVDDQHRKLVSMLNDFGEVIAENTSTKDHLFNMFQNLAAYAQEHFDTEEKLMGRIQVDIRHLKSHLKQHADFVTDISILAESIDEDKSEDRRMLLEYLIHWLAFHILGTDQNLARQVAEIQAGASPKEAFDNGEKEANSLTEPLVVALNGLFAIVSKRNKALRDLNHTLETRVAERTEELVKANRDLKKISVTDHLTELPNRRFAMSQLQLLFEEARTSIQPLSCIMIDADGFKEINDTYGHDAGDVVLKQLAKELKYSVRSDDIVCRLGGDEFIIICPKTDLEGAIYLGELTRKRIASVKIPAGQGHWIGSVSIGVTSTTENTKDISTFIKAADDAVYEAKRCGRNCVKSK